LRRKSRTDPLVDPTFMREKAQTPGLFNDGTERSKVRMNEWRSAQSSRHPAPVRPADGEQNLLRLRGSLSGVSGKILGKALLPASFGRN